jgi:hypothetical protein
MHLWFVRYVLKNSYGVLHKKYSKIGNQELSDRIKRLSPVAWRHINLIGKYEFCLNQKIIDIQELINSALTNSEIDFASQTLN